MATKLPRYILKQNASKLWLRLYKPPKRQFLLERDVHGDLVYNERNNAVDRSRHLVLAFASSCPTYMLDRISHNYLIISGYGRVNLVTPISPFTISYYIFTIIYTPYPV